MTGKWVFLKKFLPDGTVDKYKARWTARGFTQCVGSDYTETFAPTPFEATVKIMLALTCQFN
jgi:Reverse transcriptase (RNA-dependent DNA polymerase)